MVDGFSLRGPFFVCVFVPRLKMVPVVVLLMALHVPSKLPLLYDSPPPPPPPSQRPVTWEV